MSFFNNVKIFFLLTLSSLNLYSNFDCFQPEIKFEILKLSIDDQIKDILNKKVIEIKDIKKIFRILGNLKKVNKNFRDLVKDYLKIYLIKDLLKIRDEKGNNILNFSIINKLKDLTKILLDTEKVDLNSQNSDGNTPLMLAILKREEDILNLILDYNPDLEIKNSSLKNSLMLATINGYKYAVEKILKRNPKLNEKDINGNTALIFCSERGRRDIVRIILDSGADVNLKNNENLTALDLSKKIEDFLTSDLLIKFGAQASLLDRIFIKIISLFQ